MENKDGYMVCRTFDFMDADIIYESYRLRLDEIIAWTPCDLIRLSGFKVGHGSRILTANGTIFTDTTVSEIDQIMKDQPIYEKQVPKEKEKSCNCDCGGEYGGDMSDISSMCVG